MAEAEHIDKTTPHRRHYQQNRPPYSNSNRGRGRLDPHVSKALHNFGVTDLRELLDRKQQFQSKSGPPPDPSYSYLKDPLREDTHYDNSSRIYHKERPERVPDSWSRGHSPRGSRGRGSYANREDKRHQIEASFIQNPVNIKIALTTSTGERSCKLDEEKKLVDIKYVSDRRPQERRSFRGEGGGGRGRGGRGRGRSGSAPERYSGDMRKEARGRGGHQMERGRERGGYNPRTSNRNNNQNSSGQNAKAVEDPAEDNWDSECSNPPPNQNESFEKTEQGDSLDLDKINTQNSDEYEPEEYYTEDDVPSEVIEQILLQREAEENLVITSSIPEKNDDGKRTVKFKLVDKADDSAAQSQPADKEDIKSEHKVPEDEETNKQKYRRKGRAKTVKREVIPKQEVNDKRREKLTVEKEKPVDVAKDELANEKKNT